jgi:ATP-binding cassette subfamily B protein
MQDNSLFNTTIRENLLYAKPDATEEELITALKKAKAGFVLNLED